MRAQQAETLEDKVYQILRDKILSGNMISGQKLVQEDLAAELGVSRTPLRSAIAKLHHEKFVNMNNRSEATVAEFGPTEIADLFELRAVLEGLICRLLAPTVEKKHVIYLRSLMTSVDGAARANDVDAYREADIEFHTYLSNLVAGYAVSQLLDSAHSAMRICLSPGILRAPSETHAEHLAIIDALEARDSDGAEKAMINHVRKTIALLRQHDGSRSCKKGAI